MTEKYLDEFGRILIEKVRDETIDYWERTIDGRMRGQSAEDMRIKLSSFSKEQLDIIYELIPKVVDTSLHNLLWTLEQEESIELSLEFDDKKINSIKDISDGLAGELYTEDGWIQRFSKKEHFD